MKPERALRLVVLAVSLCGAALAPAAAGAAQVAAPRCEYLVNPLGVHEPTPRLSWIVESPRRGERQTACQVLVASSAERLAKDQGDLWDSGKVAAEDNAQVAYAGQPLASRQACFWKARVWDRDDQPSAWCAPADWEMGLLKAEDWGAQWIEGVCPPDAETADRTLSGATWIWFPEPGVDLKRTAPAGERFFRRRVTVPANVRPTSASLLLTVDDQFTLWVNGKEVATFAEKDGWRRPQRFDLLPHLAAGDNVVAVRAVNAGDPAGLCAKVTIRYPDGKAEILTSDAAWKVSDRADEGWTTAAFNDGAWKPAAAICPMGQGVWGAFGENAAPAPAPILRKTFKLAAQPVVRARLFATALGLYEIHVNGRRVGDHLLAPEWTDYRKRIRYQAYDVTSLLRPGDNAVAAMIANGWYSGHIGNGGYQHYGKVPALLAQLEVTYADGRVERVVTDGSWKMHPSPIVSTDFMLGEDYDARREVKGWSEPGLDDGAWAAAAVRREAPRPLEGQVTQPVRQTGTIKPREIAEPQPGRWTFDLGQNLVGVVQLKVSAPAGTRITIRHAEMLNPDGTIYTTNLRGAPSVDHYICKGGGDEVWQPHFAFHGFRYVELTGLPAKPGLDAVTAIVIGSDTPRTGMFACSDPRLNQLQSNIEWGQRGNYLSVPTDCPQRDERLGWMGDAQVFVRTATHNADVAAFFTKWLVDVDDAQNPEGAFPDVSPRTCCSDGTPAWADAGVICPWTIYLAYGDRRVLERHYPAMRRWIEWCRVHSTDLIRDRDRGGDYGDWLSIGADTPKDLIGTAYFAYSTRLVARAARVLGQADDAAKYEQLFEDIKAAFNKRYVAADGRIRGNTQCCYTMALKFDLLPPGLRAKAAQYLVEDIRGKGGHLSTGFVGVSYLLPVLTRAGELDTAFQLLVQDTFPSWLFSVKHGATTIWERWDGWTPDKGFQDPGMNSFNHYSLGSCGEWMFDTLAGIALDEEKPGYRHVIIHPRAGGGITSARARLETMRGPVATDWKLEGGTYTLACEIPVGAVATVYVPARSADAVTEDGKPAQAAEGVKFLRLEDGAAVFAVGTGTYRFASR
jgi:alpha-L-rhamnosidase